MNIGNAETPQNEFVNQGIGFEYYAFISYKREDEKWAKWLQNKLMTYKLPAALRKEIPRLPKRIHPVFRDKTDLGPCILTEGLRKELERSQYLIVVCSPKAAKSEWVGKEIDAFSGMGRADRIIPFIVEGEPNSNNDRECFHPVIKEKIPETLGINVNEIGKQQAFVKVAAKLLDLRFDALWGRFQREQRKQRFFAAAVALVCLVGAGFVGDYYRTKTEYYADYVDRWGIPEGVIRLTKAQVSKRNAHYRFERWEGKLRRVVYANSAGTPINHDSAEYIDRPAIQVLEYKQNRLSDTELKNAQGETMVVYFWSGKNLDRIDIKQDKDGAFGSDLAQSFTSMSNLFDAKKNNKADIKRFKLMRNEKGYIIRKEFKRHNGVDSTSVKDTSGVWGFEYDLDDSGRPVEVRYLGYDGKPLPNNKGIMGRKYEYDKYGNISQVVYFGKDNEPILNEQLWAICENLSNNDGNIVESSFGGRDRNSCLREGGYAKSIQGYNKHGNLTEQTFFGLDNKLHLTWHGYAKMKMKYDKRGTMMEEIAYFDTDGNPCQMYLYYAKMKMKYDKRGNIIEKTYFDANGNPCEIYGNYAKETMKYDKRGIMMEGLAYFDTNGNPCEIADQHDYYAKKTWKHNKRGNVIEEAYFGIDGDPCENRYGAAKITWKYNKDGNASEEEAYFDKAGNPCLNDYQGYAKITWKYDDGGRIIEEAYFDPNSEPCQNYDGYAKKTIKYNDDENITTEEAYFDVNDEPCQNDDGYAKATARYNKDGRIVELAYFGIDGSPCLKGGHFGGYVKKTTMYDERGDLRGTAYFGIDGNPCLDNYYRCSKMTIKYNERGQITERAYFDTNGNPCRTGDFGGGYAKEKIKYDELGRNIEEAYFDIDSNPCPNNYGYAKRTMKYNDYGNMIEMVYFGIDGKPCVDKNNGVSKWTITYRDYEHGRRQEEKIGFGIDGSILEEW